MTLSAGRVPPSAVSIFPLSLCFRSSVCLKEPKLPFSYGLQFLVVLVVHHPNHTLESYRRDFNISTLVKGVGRGASLRRFLVRVTNNYQDYSHYRVVAHKEYDGLPASWWGMSSCALKGSDCVYIVSAVARRGGLFGVVFP